jgi:hypothetical protein
MERQVRAPGIWEAFLLSMAVTQRQAQALWKGLMASADPRARAMVYGFVAIDGSEYDRNRKLG